MIIVSSMAPTACASRHACARCCPIFAKCCCNSLLDEQPRSWPRVWGCAVIRAKREDVPKEAAHEQGRRVQDARDRANAEHERVWIARSGSSAEPSALDRAGGTTA